jgi:hypothetical protein
MRRVVGHLSSVVGKSPISCRRPKTDDLSLRNAKSPIRTESLDRRVVNIAIDDRQQIRNFLRACPVLGEPAVA